MLPASYARLAGVQSEVNKVTITRLANSEVQYRRKIDSYRKDMNMNISGIKREQVLLHRSMLRYRKKIKQIKLKKTEIIQKEKESEFAEKNMLQIVSIKDCRTEVTEDNEEDVKSKIKTEKEDGIDEELNTERTDSSEAAGKVPKEDDQVCFHNTEQECETTGKSKNCKRHTLKQGRPSVSFNSLTTLSAIAEGDERDSEQMSKTVKEESATPDIPFYFSPRPTKTKKKKGNVSYSDLIKLQHSSSNTKLLIKLVDKLANNNLIQEKRETIPDIRDHIHFRGESPAFASSITKTAAVLYPIKFGYAAGSDTFPEQHVTLPVSDCSSHASECDIQKVVHYGNSFDLGATTHLSKFQPKRKRLLSLPELVQEVSRIKSLEKHGHSPRDQSPTRMGSRPNSLTPIERAQIDRNAMHGKHNGYKVAWQSALAKIKTVHTLVNYTGMF